MPAGWCEASGSSCGEAAGRILGGIGALGSRLGPEDLMSTIDELFAPATGDADLVARHRAAVAAAGPSPVYDSVDASGRVALAMLHSDDAPALPFRVTWLALHARGLLPTDDDRANPVWDAFC